MDPRATGAVAAAIRNALNTDPGARPPSAVKLVEKLRRAAHTELPQGVVAFVATEVAYSPALSDDDADESTLAKTRLLALVGSVVDHFGGHQVRADHDTVLAVFSDASAAAHAALRLQDRLRDPATVGFDIGVRIGLEVGQAELVDGVYMGAAVDRVAWLRSIAAPGAIVTSQGSVDVLRVVGDDTVIVELGTATNRARPNGIAVCALTRPGHEHDVGLDPAVASNEPIDEVARVPAPLMSDDRSGRGRVVLEAFEHPLTLTAVLVAGLALIYLVVLAPDLGFGVLGLGLLVVAVGVAVVSFARQYAEGYEDEVVRRERARLEREQEEATRRRDDEMRKLRRELEVDLGKLADPTSRRRLGALSEEFEGIQRELARERDGTVTTYAHVIPGLAVQTYMAGLSVLSQALGLLEEAVSPRRRRLERDLVEVTDWLADPRDGDGSERRRREEQRRLYEQSLARLDEAQDGARDALLEVERCEHTLHDARVQLASMRAGGASDSADAVIETLEANIQRVREVQDELRKLQY